MRPAYRRPELPIPIRVQDLLSQMSNAEKARQLDMFSGADVVDRMECTTRMAPEAELDELKLKTRIGDLGCGVIHDLYPVAAGISNELQRWFRSRTRLGIPVLLMEEALHGLNRPMSTVFPQCIGLGATFDPELTRRIGAAIAAESRAVGIHFALSPVLCLARDPRWGRAEETFGEDPWLVGQLGKAYVEGMQGNLGPLNVVAEPKHFAGHGSPAGGLNQGPLNIGEREMREIMLRAFQPAFVEAGALGAMCAYHEWDGIPCAANPWLLTDLLRDEWKFEGVVVSDLGAIRQLMDKHFVAQDARDAICQALTAGVDIQFYDFDHPTWLNEIVAAVELGQLEQAVLDRAVARVLTLKFRLGLFDNPETDPELNGRVCRSQSHLDLSLEAARKSLVLLKNDNQLLPLSRDIRKIALLGPSADVIRFGDYSGKGDGKAKTILQALRELLPEAEILHVPAVEIDRREVTPIPPEWLHDGEGGRGLRGEYFASGSFEKKPDVVRHDATIDFNWALALPAPGLPADGFAVRWTGFLTPDRTLRELLSFTTADAVRVWIDGMLVIDAWEYADSLSTPIAVASGEEVSLRIEWKKRGCGSLVSLGLGKEAEGMEPALYAARQSDVAILALGESDRTSGEGIDRCELGLPGRQSELFRAVAATGTPTIVVLQNGRALSIPEVASSADAILEAWYPGERGGEAVAEALVGRINPGGRLPVTVARSVGQLPLTYDRKPSNRGRYVESDSSPLWEFGFGLSYTQFSYSGLTVSSSVIEPDGSVEVVCEVKNIGSREGDEVVQLYLSDPVASVTRPVRWLAGCERITLQPGERRKVHFIIGPRELEFWSRTRRWEVEAGEYRFAIGGSQRGELSGSFRVENAAQTVPELVLRCRLDGQVVGNGMRSAAL